MPLKVIGAGLGRTGTASLKVALEELGIGRCYHMTEVRQHPNHANLWTEAAAGSPDWEQLFADYGAAVDYPTCAFWRELADYYPSAKVVLTIRDANGWFESTQATIFSPAVVEWLKISPMKTVVEKVYSEFGVHIHERDFMVPYFQRRTEEIKEGLAPGRLLVYEVKQGWEPLCKFLQLPVPDRPFPHVNSREETTRFVQAMTGRKPGDSSDETLNSLRENLFHDKSGGG